MPSTEYTAESAALAAARSDMARLIADLQELQDRVIAINAQLPCSSQTDSELSANNRDTTNDCLSHGFNTQVMQRPGVGINITPNPPRSFFSSDSSTPATCTPTRNMAVWNTPSAPSSLDSPFGPSSTNPGLPANARIWNSPSTPLHSPHSFNFNDLFTSYDTPTPTHIVQTTPIAAKHALCPVQSQFEDNKSRPVPITRRNLLPAYSTPKHLKRDIECVKSTAGPSTCEEGSVLIQVRKGVQVVVVNV
ncbi:hypothetical protein IAQ61_004941 [Plenodomus lingam]|uniref:Predicted protein n=1 Tax=Leptosphaeria maculans (strain JN3 / isolate v23.1.3 / race Av1-4-5-6-7-8) TaxID=985895 RepID=E4ZTA8_LEPMJ|nr:predicted protein [Plenodomus lingam JN3]KAH9872541.1 hypothetical protein IAQ61_004941 [Plenodomus lingam]CBX90050.1 predicted protein [Plenodomus lingam JN3]